MPTACASSSVNDAFFAPIANLAETSRHARPCPEISDAQWIRAGIQRVLEDVPSGRAFLQEHGLRFAQPPKVSNYFSSLQSERRAAVLQDVIDGVLGQVVAGGMNRLGHIPELERYVCFAVDMHWHKAASHDEPYDGRKAAVGHCFSLQLHDQNVRHLAVGEGQHEHDMSVLQRLTPQGLRQGVPKGRRVLVIYDRAGVDLRFWKRCRHENAVYFLSRAKLNMIFEWAEERPWDPQDSRNHGVHHDQWVVSREGHRLRLIEYQDAESGREFMFLTNEPDLPPGVLAELYRRRWEVEKVFDEIKNKLGRAEGVGQQPGGAHRPRPLCVTDLQSGGALPTTDREGARHPQRAGGAAPETAHGNTRRDLHRGRTDALQPVAERACRHPAQCEVHSVVARFPPRPLGGGGRSGPSYDISMPPGNSENRTPLPSG
jgi:hypothetical protein